MGKKKPKSNDDPNSKTVCRNRKARHNFDILEDMECGIVLKGSEVKSIRNGKMSIDEAYARLRDGELWLMGSNIAEYPQATVMNHEPVRPRKLLLHKKQLRKFAESAHHKGLTIVPLSVYFAIPLSEHMYSRPSIRTGDDLFGTLRVSFHATCVSVMSPLPPTRTAQSSALE